MNHQDAEQMLARRPELTEIEEARLEEHLQSCSQCRETAEVYARQASLMRALPVIAPPPALRAGVLAGIRRQPRRWSFRPLFALGPLGLVATAVLAALVYQNRPSPSSRLNQSAQPAIPARPTAVPSAGRKQAVHAGAPRRTHQSGKRHGAPLSVASHSGSKAGGTSATGFTQYGSSQGSAPSNRADQSSLPPTPLPSSQNVALSAAPRHTSASAPKGAIPPVTGGGGKSSGPTRPSNPPAAPVKPPSATPKPKSPAPPTIIAAAPQPTAPAVAAPATPPPPTPAPVIAASSSATPTPTRTP